MGRSSIGWRRSATSNTVSNDNTEENYATCHREAHAWKTRKEQKTRLAEEITKDVMDILHYGEEAVSVAIEEIERQDWAEKVYKPEILTSPEKLYKKPGLI